MSNVELTVISGETVELGLSIPGVQGPIGPGVESGGTTGQVLRKASNGDYDTEWVDLTYLIMEGNAAISNDDIVDGAGITDNKLATITGANKVANSATSAVSAGFANTIVLRDGFGDFSAGRATLTGLSVTGVATINGTDIVSFIEGLPLPSLDNVQVVYSGGLVVGASYPSGTPYDYVSVVYSGGLLSQVDYKLGGVNGGSIATFVVSYSGIAVSQVTKTL